MNVAILHYHLGWGGVTRVIANHAAAVQTSFRVGVVHGGRCEGWPADAPDVPRITVDGLEYDEGTSGKPDDLAGRLREALARLDFAPADTIIHAHNHALGKNLSLPGALTALAGDGYALLLHTHDFAEDFRSENYRRLADAPAPTLPNLYASAPHVHHAVLNRRDEAVLCTAGVPRERIHLLPNPVPDPGALAPRDEARQRLAASRGVSPEACLLLYPVRGIRRKNLGEALLWSVLNDDTHLAVTLPPSNPVELESYNHWKALVERLGLPCHFEIGEELQLAESLAAADLVLTTSVAEGFGLVFLEPWLAGRPLVGRDLPEITADFVTDGLALDGVRARLDVPVDWVGYDRFRDALTRSFRRTLGTYRRPMPPRQSLERGVRAHLRGDAVDFASLAPWLQAEVIEAVARDPGRQRDLRDRNPWIRRASDSATATVERNAEVVRNAYSLEVCASRLERIYHGLGAASRSCEIEPAADSNTVLDAFLDLKRFHPIRAAA